jgi:hypothetical protein
MTTGIEELKLEKKRKGRGLGRKPALYGTSLRLPKNVLDFFEAHYPHSKQVKMREILTAYVNSQTNGEPND